MDKVARSGSFGTPPVWVLELMMLALFFASIESILELIRKTSKSNEQRLDTDKTKYPINQV